MTGSQIFCAGQNVLQARLAVFRNSYVVQATLQLTSASINMSLPRRSRFEHIAIQLRFQSYLQLLSVPKLGEEKILLCVPQTLTTSQNFRMGFSQIAKRHSKIKTDS
jgi:hypothetical protein